MGKIDVLFKDPEPQKPYLAHTYIAHFGGLHRKEKLSPFNKLSQESDISWMIYRQKTSPRFRSMGFFIPALFSKDVMKNERAKN